MANDAFDAPVKVCIEDFLEAVGLDDDDREVFDRLLENTPSKLKAANDVTVNATIEKEHAREALDDELAPEEIAVDLSDLRDGLEAALAGDRRLAMYLLCRCFEDIGAGAAVSRTIEDLCLAPRPANHPELPIFTKGH